ncbi:MAG: hypothetical protein ACR2NU_06390 [Aeoliella sp.]
MKRLGSTCAALALGAAFATAAIAQQSVQQADYRTDGSTTGNAEVAAAYGQLSGGVQLASYSSCNLGGGDCYGGDGYGDCYGDCYGGDCCGDACGCDTGGCCGGGLCGDGGWQYFFGAEYLAVRALPSEAVSYLTRDVSNLTSPSDTFSQFDFDYEGSYRVYGGLRSCCCGEEIRFTYTRYDTGAAFRSPDVPAGSNGSIQFISPLEVVATIDGQRVEGTTDVELDSFDLGWSKTIPLGSPIGDCGCGDACCGDACCDDGCCGGVGCGDCCDCCYCPAWDITFTGALRSASLDAQRQFGSFGTSNEPLTTGRSRFEFDGVGARVGMLGRRYLGRRGIASIYLKGDISLLVGEYSSLQERASAATPNQVTSQSIACTHVIPVTEIEAGGTLFVTCNTSISGGYFISAWHDLGFRDEYDFGLQTSYDDANIMGFDGFFARIETAF